MEEFTIFIAGAALGVRSGFGSTREYFREFWTEQPPEVTVEALPEDAAREQVLLDLEADQLGLRRRVFTPPFLERAVIQRKAAGYLLQRGVLLLHGSTLAVDGRAYLFTAPCGVGKSTHTRLWRQLLGERAVMVNDDRAFLTIGEAGVIAWGSPWSGKHGIHSNIHAKLSGICILERGRENCIAPLPAAQALPELLEQAFLPEEEQAQQVKQLTEALAQKVPLWRMACTQDIQAAQIAYAAMAAGGME